jgi:hypothetical protein
MPNPTINWYLAVGTARSQISSWNYQSTIFRLWLEASYIPPRIVALWRSLVENKFSLTSDPANPDLNSLPYLSYFQTCDPFE